MWKKKKKNPEGLNVFFSVNYFKGPMERLRDKRPLCLQADCILRSQIPAVAQEDEEFSKCTFFFFFVTGESLLPTPLQKKKRKIFCNFCASNHYTHASTQALLIWGSKKSLEGRHPSPFCRKKNISSVSPVSFSTWGGKKLCFKLHSGLLPTASPPSHHHGYWATTPMRHHDGGRS